MQLDESSDFTRVSTKGRHDQRSHLSNAMRARLGPQSPSIGGKPYVAETLEARLGPSAATIISELPYHPLTQQHAGTPMDWAPPDFVVGD